MYPRISPLQLRKQLLIAESDLNRAQLVHDLQLVADGVRSVAYRARSFRSIATAAVVLVAGLAAFRRRRPVQSEAKPSWLQTILKGAGLISNLWLSLRSKGRDRDAT